MPLFDHTGTPRHFHSSMTSGSASRIRVRSRLSIWPRQSPSSLILASISCEADWLSFRAPLFFRGALFFVPVFCFVPLFFMPVSYTPSSCQSQSPLPAALYRASSQSQRDHFREDNSGTEAAVSQQADNRTTDATNRAHRRRLRCLDRPDLAQGGAATAAGACLCSTCGCFPRSVTSA